MGLRSLCLEAKREALMKLPQTLGTHLVDIALCDKGDVEISHGAIALLQCHANATLALGDILWDIVVCMWESELLHALAWSTLADKHIVDIYGVVAHQIGLPAIVLQHKVVLHITLGRQLHGIADTLPCRNLNVISVVYDPRGGGA